MRVVLLSAGPVGEGKHARSEGSSAKPQGPSVIRVRGGELKYSDAEHKAVMRAAPVGGVVTQTADGTTRSDEVELVLLPPGNHAGRDGGAAQVDRMIDRDEMDRPDQTIGAHRLDDVLRVGTSARTSARSAGHIARARASIRARSDRGCSRPGGSAR